MKQRLEWATIRLDGHDGSVYAHLLAGNQIGSCEGPLLFCLPYRDSLFDWRWDSRELSPALTLETPGGVVSDAGLQVFADDVFERRVVISGEAAEAFDVMTKSG